MKVCELKIRDMASVQSMVSALTLNKYTVVTEAIYKEYPYDAHVDYFRITVSCNQDQDKKED